MLKFTARMETPISSTILESGATPQYTNYPFRATSDVTLSFLFRSAIFNRRPWKGFQQCAAALVRREKRRASGYFSRNSINYIGIYMEFVDLCQR
jgi:hypothetical protein